MTQAIGTVANPEIFFGNDLVEYNLQALSQSLIVEELEVEHHVARPLDYDDLVDQGKALHVSDIARFACPDLEDPMMLWGRPEYFRWYTADGKKRIAPLDYDELVALVQYRDKCSLDDAEREVSLHSRAHKGDKQQWDLMVKFGYVEWADMFAAEEFSVF